MNPLTSLFSVETIVRNIENIGAARSVCILGSGWNHVIEKVKIIRQWQFNDVFGVFPTAAGHRGMLILGSLGDQEILFMAGRLHTYEGFNTEEVTRPLQALQRLGLVNAVVTSAAGGLNEAYQVGDIVVLSDILALLCQSPLPASKFQDLSQPFDINLRQIALDTCKKEDIAYQEGVYAYVKGPHYESFSDKKALRSLGADCVGMSTVPETVMGNFLGLKMLGLSCITNLAFVKHSHEEVLSNAESQQDSMVKLLTGVLERIAK